MRLPPLTFTAAEAAGLVMAVLEGHKAAADPADLAEPVSPELTTALFEACADGSKTRLVASTSQPEWYAGRLAVLPFAFLVTESPPLRAAVAELGWRFLAASADAGQ